MTVIQLGKIIEELLLQIKARRNRQHAKRPGRLLAKRWTIIEPLRGWGINRRGGNKP